MDLQDQLKQLFPEHQTDNTTENLSNDNEGLWLQDDPLVCKYEKRKGKPVTIIEGYNGANDDFKQLTTLLKKSLSVGGTFKKEIIIIQGDYRNEIMEILNNLGFNTKRVGG
ncbi:MAG: translation initiation factor [Flavobacteriaceae bacterium]